MIFKSYSIYTTIWSMWIQKNEAVFKIKQATVGYGNNWSNKVNFNSYLWIKTRAQMRNLDWKSWAITSNFNC